MKKLYYKDDDGEFHEWGVGYNVRELPDGLWVISGKGSRMQSLGWRMEDLPKPLDCVLLLKNIMCEDIIIDAINDSGVKLYNVSPADVANSIIKQMYIEVKKEEDKLKEQKEEE